MPNLITTRQCEQKNHSKQLVGGGEKVKEPISRL